jgi:hypothetical protein
MADSWPKSEPLCMLWTTTNSACVLMLVASDETVTVNDPFTGMGVSAPYGNTRTRDSWSFTGHRFVNKSNVSESRTFTVDPESSNQQSSELLDH